MRVLFKTIPSMGKGSSQITTEFISGHSKTGFNMDMENIVGRMDLYIEGILKKGNAKVRDNIIILKIAVLPGASGKEDC